MKYLKSIWQKPIYLPYLQPELTENILENFEKNLKYKLPSELIELLKIQNGGYIRKKLEELPNEQIYGIGPYFPSIERMDWEEYEEWVSFELEGLVPFDGDGHWYICLDYRENKLEPQVTYIDTECDNQNIVAKTFSEYLLKLSIDTSDELVIKTNKSIEEIVVSLENILEIKFEKPDNWAHGYNQYRSKLNESWIWLSPNKVPYGFVRENEDRYEELIQLTKSNALRYPEISISHLLLSFSDKEIGSFAVEKLLKNSIDIIKLSEII